MIYKEDLLKLLADIPGNPPVFLCDLSFDDETENLYSITERSVGAVEGEDREGNPAQAILITFDNKLNTNQ